MKEEKIVVFSLVLELPPLSMSCNLSFEKKAVKKWFWREGSVQAKLALFPLFFTISLLFFNLLNTCHCVQS